MARKPVIPNSVAAPRAIELYSSNDSDRELAVESPASGFRSAFRRDFGRLIHSPAFRRLQGKTQLFPSSESEFFRNRLTHSLEVAQIAKGIAAKINFENPDFATKATAIDLDIVETAGLGHDLGHPPFGHIGESILDYLMRNDGGFEGNAQTLRILARLEKKEGWQNPFDKKGNDRRLGLNLSYRTLAAALKYDSKIPLRRKDRKNPTKLMKGYYLSEADLVAKIKKNVYRNPKGSKVAFKTVECRIMDLADDIAYSTYDLEDALKAGFITPLEIVSAASDKALLKSISQKVSENIGSKFTEGDVVRVLLSIFTSRGYFDGAILEQVSSAHRLTGELAVKATAAVAIHSFDTSNKVGSDGYRRSQLTSSLVDEFISGVSATWNVKEPALSSVSFRPSVLEQVEVLKHYTFAKLIMSPRIKLVEYRGTDIVRKIFMSLNDKKRKGFELLPDDYRHWYECSKDGAIQKRVICDFVAGMTDRYAIEFYDRLVSSKPETFFKPH